MYTVYTYFTHYTYTFTFINTNVRIYTYVLTRLPFIYCILHTLNSYMHACMHTYNLQVCMGTCMHTYMCELQFPSVCMHVEVLF